MISKNSSDPFDRQIVYVKEVDPSELPADIDLEMIDGERFFALHDVDGAQIAVAANLELAYHLARVNDLVPLTLH
jgi:hypothetical protein